MSNTAVIQVRVLKAIKEQSEAKATELGFTSVQEAIRVFLVSFAKGWARPGIFTKEDEAEYIKLTPRARKRYARMFEDFKHNRNVYHAKDVDDLLHQLDS